MQKRNKLAKIVNRLSDDELANLSPHAALTLQKSVRDQPRGRDADAALKRLATHLLCESATATTFPASPSCTDYLLGAPPPGPRRP